jgi:uncharacterized protein
MKKESDSLVYSPSDLMRFVASPFASWMDRYYLENPKNVTPDEQTDEQVLIAQTGDQHEHSVLEELKLSVHVEEIPRSDLKHASAATTVAIASKVPIIYQAALSDDRFAGYSDFLILDSNGYYQVWDTKLARSPKPYYIIQLCCYSEMLATTSGNRLPQKCGVILGSKDKIEFRVEDFVHYYRKVKDRFLAMQDGFIDDLGQCPEPLPRADHGRWTSQAEKFFDDNDHLVRVAGITIGQIKKLKASGINTMASLAGVSGEAVNKMAPETLDKLVSQARLQCRTREDRKRNPDAPATIEILPHVGINNEVRGLAILPANDPADVYFDMEGFPLHPGGLEYLFGATTLDSESGAQTFYDWWGHDRDEERGAFEQFIDWVHDRWQKNPAMHIFHYAPYEVSAVRRLSTRHDSRQDKVDDMLRASVFIDLYKVVRQGLRIGIDDYSIKSIEHLYRPKRSTEIATATESMVQYAAWMESNQPRDWKNSPILKSIRDYNEDDCKSTSELLQWLREIATKHGIPAAESKSEMSNQESAEKELPPEVEVRHKAIDGLRKQGDPVSLTLSDLVDFHRREEKPMWWRMFDRADATAEELQDDSGCIHGVRSIGSPVAEKQSQVQTYQFDPSQECKLADDGKTKVMFSHDLSTSLSLTSLDLNTGTLQLKVSNRVLAAKFRGKFPQFGSLIKNEYVSAKPIQAALTEIANRQLSSQLHQSISSLLNRLAPTITLRVDGESTIHAAIRVANEMTGGCLVIQGPPGTGKTYTAAHVVDDLLGKGKTVGVTSNGHKAIVNLLVSCGQVAQKGGRELQGIKVAGDQESDLFKDNPQLRYVPTAKDADSAYSSGVVGGTAWLFSLPEWENRLDYLFIDEAGQVSLANAIAMAQSAHNIILIGDQMQLEQPIQGTHPGDAGLSSLQYALKDLDTSQPDFPKFHAVIDSDYGLFLSESRRMHPSICQFISESIYEGRLGSHPDCVNQALRSDKVSSALVSKEFGIVFSPVEHDGNVQRSDEEVARVKAIYEELLGQEYIDSQKKIRKLVQDDFLFISPYNAQVRALKDELPEKARVGSVDKFQGQEAPVCILSLCSSYGEYGSRGLAFILDRNRINVALSRARCLVVVVADPRIATSSAGSIDEMRLLNVFCKITDHIG